MPISASTISFLCPFVVSSKPLPAAANLIRASLPLIWPMML
jgi:hypothetical protein